MFVNIYSKLLFFLESVKIQLCIRPSFTQQTKKVMFPTTQVSLSFSPGISQDLIQGTEWGLLQGNDNWGSQAKFQSNRRSFVWVEMPLKYGEISLPTFGRHLQALNVISGRSTTSSPKPNFSWQLFCPELYIFSKLKSEKFAFFDIVSGKITARLIFWLNLLHVNGKYQGWGLS